MACKNNQAFKVDEKLAEKELLRPREHAAEVREQRKACAERANKILAKAGQPPVKIAMIL